MKKEDAEKMTVQELCDFSVRKLVEQGKQCVVNGTCLYSDGQGNHCAVGWLLDESDHDLMSHKGTISSILKTAYRDNVPEILRNNQEIFSALQQFHDDETIRFRKIQMGQLKSAGINTSGSHWQQWLDMGCQNL